MKYFIKYLPVEGEIKIDDWYTGGINDIPTKRTIGRDDNMANAKCQKVKLFLCSRDIRLGDTYYHDEYLPYPDGDVADTHTKVLNAGLMIANESELYKGDESFKVIGEISPEAIWVTEGMEFEKDDWLGPIIDRSSFKAKYYIQIKCPTCGIFN